MAKAVSNATVLIFLSKLNRLDLLWNCYDVVVVPLHVKEEVLAKDSSGVVFEELKKCRIQEPKTTKDFGIGIGETQAITICLETKNTDFLSDDKKARGVAKLLKLPHVGTLGVLLWNVKKGFLSKEECLELVNKLVTKHDYFISTKLYVRVTELLKD